jgi:hypothetical protein
MSEPEPGAVARKFFLYTMIGTALYVGVVCAFVLFR